MIRLAALNSGFQTGLRSPMDEAILRHEHPAVARYTRVDEIPFDWERRRLSVVVADGARRLLITKGATESVMPLAARVELDGAVEPFDDAARARGDALFRELSREGYRLLAVAYREVEPRPAYGVDDERDLVLAGFAAFLDPPHEGVRETLAALRADGIEVKIVTGDNELVTGKICAEVGLAPVLRCPDPDDRELSRHRRDGEAGLLPAPSDVSAGAGRGGVGLPQSRPCAPLASAVPRHEARDLPRLPVAGARALALQPTP